MWKSSSGLAPVWHLRRVFLCQNVTLFVVVCDLFFSSKTGYRSGPTHQQPRLWSFEPSANTQTLRSAEMVPTHEALLVRLAQLFYYHECLCLWYFTFVSVIFSSLSIQTHYSLIFLVYDMPQICSVPSDKLKVLRMPVRFSIESLLNTM